MLGSSGDGFSSWSLFHLISEVVSAFKSLYANGTRRTLLP